MRAGTLRHRGMIQQRSEIRDPDTGAVKTEWVDFDAAWMSIEPLSAREFIAAQAAQSEISARIVMRYRDGIDATMRIVHRGKIYNIKGVLPDPVSGREYLTLPVSMGVNDG